MCLIAFGKKCQLTFTTITYGLVTYFSELSSCRLINGIAAVCYSELCNKIVCAPTRILAVQSILECTV